MRIPIMLCHNFKKIVVSMCRTQIHTRVRASWVKTHQRSRNKNIHVSPKLHVLLHACIILVHSQWGAPETKKGMLIYLPWTKVASVFNNQKICLTDLSIISFSAGSISSSISPSSNSTLFAKASSSASSNFDVSPGWGRNLSTLALWHAKLRPFESYNMEKKKSVTRQLWHVFQVSMIIQAEKRRYSDMMAQTLRHSMDSSIETLFCWSFLLRFFFLFFEALTPLESVKQSFLTSNEAFKRK